MGPFAVSDLAGLDVGWANRKRLQGTRLPEERYVAIADHICLAGDYGQKTGRGWYVYEGRRRSQPNPAVEGYINLERARKGIAPRSIPSQEIVLTTLAAAVNEACHVLDEGIAQRDSDIAVVFVHGYGFPAVKGGLMFHARQIGFDALLKTAERLVTENGPGWRISPGLRSRAKGDAHPGKEPGAIANMPPAPGRIQGPPSSGT